MTLKSYFQIGIGAGLAISLVGSIVWIKNGYSKPAAATEIEEPVDPAEAGPDARLEEDLEARTTPATAPTPENTLKKKEMVDIGKASESFAMGIKQMSACLNVSVENSDRIEPRYDNLLASLKTSFGDPIMHSEDWVVWNLRANGEERRLRIETDYSDSKANTRNLRYFKLDAQGTPSLIPLPPEQTRNPSEAFVASLQKDGELYQEEKGLRGYFENGQEMILSERDGKIDDLEITNGPKTFRCAGILTSTPQCKCY